LQKIISNFQASYPRVMLDIHRLNHRVLIDGLESGSLDVIFVLQYNTTFPSDFVWEIVYETKTSVILSSNHALASANNLKLTNIKDETFMLYQKKRTSPH
jgi:DNA-binding transcriptional LysR family regulator